MRAGGLCGVRWWQPDKLSNEQHLILYLNDIYGLSCMGRIGPHLTLSRQRSAG
jgi:hypothetical protein